MSNYAGNIIYPNGFGSGGDSSSITATAPLYINDDVLSISNATTSSTGVVKIATDYLTTPSSTIAATTKYVSDSIYYKMDRVLTSPTPGNVPIFLADGNLEDSLIYFTTDSTANLNTNVMTSSAVQSAIASAIESGTSFRGGYNASSNTFPTTGGSGTSGSVQSGNYWVITTGGTLGGTIVTIGDTITALVSNPGQTASNWSIANQKVTSVFNRTGVITAQSNDYSISQITNGLSNVLSKGMFFQGDDTDIAVATTPGSLTEATSGILTITGGTDSLLSNVSIQVKQASTSQSGYLSSAAYTTFNNKQSELTALNQLNPLYIGDGDSSIDISNWNTLEGNTFNIYDQFISIAGSFDSVEQNKQSSENEIVALTDNSIVILTALSKFRQRFTGTIALAANAAIIKLPDATTLDNKQGFYLDFASTSCWAIVQDYNGNEIIAAQWITNCWVTLLDNTTSSGTWSTYQYQSKIWGDNLLNALFIGTGVVSNTSYSYLRNVTSDIQTQLDDLEAIWRRDTSTFEIMQGDTSGSNYNLNLTKSNTNTANYIKIGNNNPSATNTTSIIFVGNISGSGTTTTTLFDIVRSTPSSANGTTTLTHSGTGDFFIKATSSAYIKLQTSAANRVRISDSLTEILNGLSGTTATFSGATTISANSGQLILGSTNTMTITAPTRTSARTFTLPDANCNPIVPSSASTNQFATGVSSGGVISYAQPSFSNLSGSVAASQMPAFTGDVTTIAGDVATTLTDNVVNNDKLAKMGSNTIKGNNTGVTANAADLTVSQTQTLLGIPTSSSSVTYANATLTNNTNQLALGTTNTTTVTMATLSANRIFTLPNANSNSVIPTSAGTGQVVTGISSGGVIVYTQPSLYYNSSNTYAIGDVISGNGTNGVVGALYCCNTAATTGAFAIANWDLVVLSKNTTFNTGVGVLALNSLSTGNWNTAIGYQALATISSNGAATAIGYQAGQFQTGASNTWVGASAGKGTSGSSTSTLNAVVGRTAGTAITTSSGNSLLGHGAGSAITSGSGYNCLWGVNSGSAITTGSNNIILGSDPGSNTLANTFIVSTPTSGTPIKIINISNINTDPAANLILATPNGSTGAATLRSLVYADLPTTLTGLTSITSAAGTTTLTSSSNYIQQVTGTTTQIVKLPNATTLSLGRSFIVDNESTGNVTINNNANSTLETVYSGITYKIICTSISTSSGTWDIYPIAGLWDYDGTSIFSPNDTNLDIVRLDTASSILTMGNVNGSNTTTSSFNISDATYGAGYSVERTYDGFTTITHRSSNDFSIKAQDNARIKLLTNNTLRMTIGRNGETTDFTQNITAPAATFSGIVTATSGLSVGTQILGQCGITSTNAAITVATNTWTSLTFNGTSQITYDPSSWHSEGINPTRIKPNAIGTFKIQGSLRFADNTGGNSVGIRIIKNGVSANTYEAFYSDDGSTNGRRSAIVFGFIETSATTDYFELQAYQDSGSTLALGNFHFHVERLI